MAHPIGTEVTYRHQGKRRRAQVTEHHPDTGEVHGLAVYDANGGIEFGVSAPKLATTPEHEITDGYFHR